MERSRSRRHWTASLTLFLLAITLFGVLHRSGPRPHLDGKAFGANGSSVPDTSTAIRVDTIRPTVGGMARTSILPGSIHAYESAELFAKISGYLEKLYVDIGDHVKSGQLLAEIFSPEYLREVDRCKASIERADAQVGQMKAAIAAAEANKKAAETTIDRATAAVRREHAAYTFRDKQYRRFQQLVEAKSVDERLVDEKEDQRLAAGAAVDAAEAALAEAKAMVVSAEAKIEQAKADLVDAQAEVEVAKANMAKAEVFATYTKVTSPYDGVITTRGFHRGDFIRTAEQGVGIPLLTVERIDVVRLVVYVPDNDVPFTDPGDETETNIDAIPQHKFTGKISRIAYSEDKKTKTMRTEVDLQNDHNLLRNGMYGKTKLMLQAGNPKAFTIPSSAMVGGSNAGKGILFVAHAGVAKKTSVTVSADNGVFAEITEGISATDHVIIGNNNALVDGRAVEINELKPIDPANKK